MAGGWDFGNPNWEKCLREGRSLLPPLPLDKAGADRAVRIFDKLRLPDVPGLPLLRDAAGEWQRDIVRVIGGGLVAGARMVPELFVLVPKKSNKTTGGAAIAITSMLMNERPRAEMIYVGPTQEVAEIAFRQTVGMIEADGYLAKRHHVAQHLKTITDRRNKATLKIKTFDMKVMVGSKPVFILLDELHVMSRMSDAGRIIGQIRGGMMANPEAVLIMITTQSDEPPAGAFKAELDYARGVRDGRIMDGRMLPIMYEFPEAMQTDDDKPWADPANWPMVMPNLGRSIHLGRLIADYAGAKERGDQEERRWASQHLNVEIGLALHSDRWRGADYWEAAADTSLTLDALIDRSECAVVGIDGGGLDDLMGMAVLGRCKTTKDWLLWCRAWAHDDVLKRRPEIAERLRDFERAGELTICKEPTQDIEEAADIVKQVFDAGLIPAKFGVGLDPMGVSALIDALEERGIKTEANGGPVCAVSQGYKLSGAVWGTERKLKDGTMWHAGQSLMAWCVGNAKVEQRGNAVVVTKAAAGKAKIDPLVAAFNAFMLMSRGPVQAAHGLTSDDIVALGEYVI